MEEVAKVTHTVALHVGPADRLREEVLTYFHNTYGLYEKLFDTITEEGFYQRADRLRHPLIFYFCHTACFFVNKMTLAKLIPNRLNPHFESLFAIGVDEMSWDDLLSDGYQWPPVSEVRQYRDQVRAMVDDVIRTAPLSVPLTWDSNFWAVLMGIEHERIHLETSAVLIRQLPLSMVRGDLDGFWAPFRREGVVVKGRLQNELVPVLTHETTVVLGRDVNHDVYGWDVDYGKQVCDVMPFNASKYLVTNAEYYEFMREAGYHDPSVWTSEGQRYLSFLQKEKRLHPVFWVAGEREGEYRLRLMYEVVDMQWDWPVEVNYLEAKAYTNWLAKKTGKKIRMPTEEEYRVMRDAIQDDQHTWTKAPGNINLEYVCSSTPVDYFPPASNGLYDVIGNVWQHTETPVDAFKGFRVHPYYDDFSVPTFDLQHNLIMGGSWISTGNEATKHARYAFRRHFHQFAGIRYVESEQAVKTRNDVYERDTSVNMYNEFHFGPSYFGITNFSKAVADLVIEFSKNYPRRRALDLGCAVGRCTFELARVFDYVLGLDFSARFIRSATNLKEKGSLRFPVPTEGDLTEERVVSLRDLGLEDHKHKCEFFQGDACNLDPRFCDYDVVLCANLLDRLYDPYLFLRMIHKRINVGGLLILTSPYTWLEEFTPKDKWVGGYIDQKTGEPVTTLDGLKKELQPRFRLVGGPCDVSMVIRETARKFQHTIVQMTVWERL